MRTNTMKNDGVSPVIAVILMVAITVVLAGVLYVWVGSLANTEDKEEGLRLQATDAFYDAGSDGSYFPASSDLIKVEQSGGDPINWNQYTVYVNELHSDSRFVLRLNSINNLPFNSTTNFQSKAGQMIVFGTTGAADFQSGDFVVLLVFKGQNKVYASPTIHLL